MDQQQIEKLKAAGYTDDDIRDYMANQPQLSNAPAQTQAETLPEIDVTKPSDTLKQAEAQGIPTGARESSFISDVATAAPIVLGENAGKVALGAGGLGAVVGANQLRKGMQARAGAQTAQAAAQTAQAASQMAQAEAAMKTAQQAAESAASHQQLQREKMAERAARNAKPGIQILDSTGRPISVNAPVVPQGPVSTAPVSTGPVVPQGPVSTGPVIPGAGPAPITAPAGPAPSLLDKTTSMIRQLAANKVMGTLAKGANVLGTAQMAAYSPELGPKTPQVGRMRGMEINPLTSRPWTPEQIKQYEANPTMFDQQMAQPQMRR